MIDLTFDEFILILEDNQGRIAKFRAKYPQAIIVQEASEAIKHLSQDKTMWDLVSLDHDLGGEVFVESHRQDCGMEVVRWIVENRPLIHRIIIHSANRSRSKRMFEALEKLYTVKRKPFEGRYDSGG